MELVTTHGLILRLEGLEDRRSDSVNEEVPEARRKSLTIAKDQIAMIE